MAKIVSGNSALDLKKSADNIFRKTMHIFVE